MSGAAQPFISTVAGSLDAKGRICIPAGFRQILAAQGTPGVYLCPCYHRAAIWGFGEIFLQDVSRQIASGNPVLDADHDDEALVILSGTQLFAPDEAGRLRLPDELIAHAGLKDRFWFLGVGNKFEIWSPENWESKRADAVERLIARRNAAAATPGGAHG